MWRFIFKELTVKYFQPFKSRDSKEIPVQQKQAVSENLGDLISVFYHLHHMGSV